VSVIEGGGGHGVPAFAFDPAVADQAFRAARRSTAAEVLAGYRKRLDGILTRRIGPYPNRWKPGKWRRPEDAQIPLPLHRAWCECLPGRDEVDGGTRGYTSREAQVPGCYAIYAGSQVAYVGEGGARSPSATMYERVVAHLSGDCAVNTRRWWEVIYHVAIPNRQCFVVYLPSTAPWRTEQVVMAALGAGLYPVEYGGSRPPLNQEPSHYEVRRT